MRPTDGWAVGLVLLLAVPGSAAAGQAVAGTVSARGQPLAQAVVYLETNAAPAGLPAPGLIRLETVAGQLVPAVQIARSGAALQLRNCEPTLRIVRLEKLLATNPPVRLLTEAMPYAGFDKQLPLETYRQPTLLRARAGDATAYIAVLPHPWGALTDAAGRFVLSNVPPARHRLHVWHPQHPPAAWTINVNSGQTALATLDLTPSR